MELRKLTRLFLLAAVPAALFYAGCAGPAKETHWYDADAAMPADAPALKGKVIVIDPGHGGKFSGAAGRKGLLEKDVNLKVAVRLRDMLLRYGAQAPLTRETDRDFLANPLEHTREDLKRRIALLDSLKPDLFVSLHHNAGEKEPPENEVKTYYKMDDTGPSLDAAAAIHGSFMRTLRIREQQLAGANYFVLWNSPVPAVLGEPSYITHPDMERILAGEKAVELEAFAYFNGIREWFEKGVPRITGVFYDTLSYAIRAMIASETPVDTLVSGMTVDGRKIPAYFLGNTCFSSTNGPLPNGRHAIRVTVANRNGNWALAFEKIVVIRRELAAINAYYPRIKACPGERVPVKVVLYDGLGFPAPDGLLINTNAKQATVSRGGEGTVYPVAGELPEITVSCGRIELSIGISADRNAARFYQGFIRSEAQPLKAMVSAAGVDFSCDYNGFFEYPEEQGPYATVRCEGYIDSLCSLKVSSNNLVSIRKSWDGLFFDRNIIIDPEAGGIESGGYTRNGVRACDINRKTALLLFGRLEKSGAMVSMARDGDNTVPVSERIKKASSPRQDLYILIRTDTLARKPYISYYPSSRFGGSLAQFIKQAAENMALDAQLVEESGYILQQTPCTAVAVSFSNFANADALNHEKLDDFSLAVHQGIYRFLEYLKANKQDLN